MNNQKENRKKETETKTKDLYKAEQKTNKMGGKPTLIGLLSLKEGTPESLLSLLAHIVQKGHTEHTASWLARTHQKERSHQQWSTGHPGRD